MLSLAKHVRAFMRRLTFIDTSRGRDDFMLSPCQRGCLWGAMTVSFWAHMVGRPIPIFQILGGAD
jgi:hypothetical protein